MFRAFVNTVYGTKKLALDAALLNAHALYLKQNETNMMCPNFQMSIIIGHMKKCKKKKKTRLSSRDGVC
jgi:hypothetical protein